MFNFLYLEVALTIRPRLSEVLSPEEAEQKRRELDEFLRRIQGGELTESLSNELWELLTSNKNMSREATAEKQKIEEEEKKGFQNLPAPTPDPIPVPRFKCPKCDYIWFRPIAGAPTSFFCPNHNDLLERIN